MRVAGACPARRQNRLAPPEKELRPLDSLVRPKSEMSLRSRRCARPPATSRQPVDLAHRAEQGWWIRPLRGNKPAAFRISARKLSRQSNQDRLRMWEKDRPRPIEFMKRGYGVSEMVQILERWATLTDQEKIDLGFIEWASCSQSPATSYRGLLH